eukprot:553646-Rhodomonas_salina.3
MVSDGSWSTSSRLLCSTIVVTATRNLQLRWQRLVPTTRPCASNGTIAAFTREWRAEMHWEILYYQDEGLKHFINTHLQIQGYNSLCPSAICLLKRAGITGIRDLIATGDSDWLHYAILRKQCPTLSAEQYQTLLEVLNRHVPLHWRTGMSLQTSLPQHFTELSHAEHVTTTACLFPEHQVPPEFSHQPSFNASSLFLVREGNAGGSASTEGGCCPPTDFLCAHQSHRQGGGPPIPSGRRQTSQSYLPMVPLCP